MPQPVVVATARSAIGRAFKGALIDVRADDLATQVIQAALVKVPALNPHEIEDMFVGSWEHSGEQGENLARRVAVLLGLDDVPAVAVNRACASSLQATLMAAHAIRAGEGDVFVAAGVESVSRYVRQGATGSGHSDTWNPAFEAAASRTRRLAETNGAWSDPRGTGDLPDIYIAMGQTAENVAALTGVSRRDQDDFAARSQQLAAAAVESGFSAREICPLRLPNGEVFDRDESVRPTTTIDGLAALPPAFRDDGTVTAGNCCPLSDGASAAIVMSDSRARDLGITPLARLTSFGTTALSPEIMGLGPVRASEIALTRAGMTMPDVDLVEINEAFAAQVIPCYTRLQIDIDRLNIHGGAIAIGHPFGSTGARLLGTLINGLQTYDWEVGLETLCVGGGQGMAVIIERLS